MARLRLKRKRKRMFARPKNKSDSSNSVSHNPLANLCNAHCIMLTFSPEDVSSTRNALRIAAQAEETGRETLARLGAQGEMIHETEKVATRSMTTNVKPLIRGLPALGSRRKPKSTC